MKKRQFRWLRDPLYVTAEERTVGWTWTVAWADRRPRHGLDGPHPGPIIRVGHTLTWRGALNRGSRVARRINTRRTLGGIAR